MVVIAEFTRPVCLRSFSALKPAVMRGTASRRGAGRIAFAAVVAALMGAVGLQAVHAQTEPVGTTSATQTASVTIATGGTLGTINVLTQGSPNKDFKYVSGGTCATGTSYSASAMCTVKYSFTASRPGQRLGGISLTDNSGSVVMGTTLVSAMGIGPLAIYPGGAVATTFASGFGGAEGVAVDGNGDVFFADGGAQVIDEVLAGTGGNPAGVVSSSSTVVTVATGFQFPVGIALDGSGNLFVGDAYGPVVYEIVAVNGVVSTSSTMITLGAGLFGQPGGVAVDAHGNVFVADYGNSTSYEIVAGTGGNAPGMVSSSSTINVINTSFPQPEGAAVDSSGNVFLSNGGDLAVVEAGTGGDAAGVVSTNSTVVTTGVACSQAVVDGSGNVFCTNGTLQEIVAGTGGNAAGVISSASTVYALGNATGVATDGLGHLFISGADPTKGQEIDLTAPPALTFPSTKMGTSSAPQSVVVENEGNSALTFTALAASTGFAVNTATTTCHTTSSLGPVNPTCNLAVKFSPVDTGHPDTGTYTLTDNTLGVSSSMQTGMLTGTGTASGTTAQTITFTQPTTPALPGASVTLSASSTSGLPITLTLISGPATLSGTTLTYYDTGTVLVEADQYGNGTYAQAAAVQRAVNVTVSSAVGTTTSTETATVTIATAGTLGTINVLTQGAGNKDFKSAGGGTCTTGTSYAANATCTVTYTFTPSQPGMRAGAVSLTDNTGAVVMGTAYLGETGTGPFATFPASTAISMVGGIVPQTPDAIAVDGSGNVFVGAGRGLYEVLATNGVVASSSSVATLSTSFNNITSLAVDGSGNLLIVDQGNSGVEEFLAINGAVSASSAQTGLGGPVFGNPAAGAVDTNGNVFVADPGTAAVYEIAAVNGTVTSTSTPVAIGSGFNQPSGVAVDGNGNVFVADIGNQAVYEIVAGTGGNLAGIVSTSSTVKTIGSGFNQPYNLSVDAAGNVFVADAGNSAVYEIVATSGVVSSASTVNLVGSGFNAPQGVAVDGKGHIFVADSGNSLTKEIDLTVAPTLSFTTTAVGSTSSNSPQTTTVQNSGNTSLTFSALATTSASFVESGTCSTGTPLAQSGECTAGASFTPMQAGPLTAALDLTDNSLNASGSVQAVALTGRATATGVTAQTITFTQPTTPVLPGSSATLSASASSGLAVTFSVVSGPAAISGTTVTYTNTGIVVIEADQYGNGTYAQAPAVQRTVNVAVSAAVGTTSATLTATVTVTKAGTSGGTNVLTLGAAGKDYQYVTGGTCSAGVAYAVNATCTVRYTFAPSRPGRRAGAVTVDDGSGTVLGTAFLSETGTAPLLIFPGSNAVSLASNSFYYSAGTAVDGSGDLFVADPATGVVWETVATGGVVNPSSSAMYIGPHFTAPEGVAVDGGGNVFVADSGANAVYELVHVNGAFSTSTPAITIGNGFSGPYGVAVDGSGDVFVADTGNGAVKEIVAVNGVVTASSAVNIVGSGFSAPKALAVDASGNVFVADSGNSAVYEIVAGTGGNATGLVSSSSTVNAVATGRAAISVAVDAAGDVFFGTTAATYELAAGTGGNSAGVVSTASTVKTIESLGAYGLALDGLGNIFVGTSGSSVDDVALTSAPTLAFGTNASTPLTATLQNAGNASLTFSALAVTSQNFALDGGTTTCSTSAPLTYDGLCSVGIDFTPQQAGSLTAYADVTDNTLNIAGTVQAITLTGTGSNQRPTITAVSPTSGSAAGGTSVTISGTYLLGVSFVRFGTKAATSYTIVNTTTITAVAPSGTAATTVDITVGNSSYTSATSTADHFTYLVGQTITFTQPTTPVARGGTATLSATGGASGNPVTFSIVSGTATLSGTNNSMISYTAGGTVVIAANQAGNATYAAATQVTRTVVVTVQAVFVVNSGGSVTTDNDSGSTQTSAASGGGIGAAVDSAGNVWSVNVGGAGVSEFTDAGVLSANYTATNLTSGMALAMDGASVMWIVQGGTKNNIFALSNTGTVLSTTGFAQAASLSSPSSVSVDTAGSLWISNSGNSTLTEVIGVAAPVTAPTVKQVINQTPGVRP